MIPDTLQGAALLSVIDFFLSFIFIALSVVFCIYFLI